MKKRRLLYTLAVLFATLAFATAREAVLPPQAAAPAAASVAVQATTTPDTYFVVKVVDGDTVDINRNGTTTRLRLIGMDTPEVVDPRKPVQCFGREASAEGHKLLENTWIRLEYDPVAGTYDKYGRMLAYIFLPDGTFYNEFMIRQGFAHEYDYNNQKYKYRTAFRAAQQAAEQEKKGFWADDACAGNTTKPAGAK